MLALVLDPVPARILDHDFAHSDVRIAAPELAGNPALRVHAAADAIYITPALALGLSVFCMSSFGLSRRGIAKGPSFNCRIAAFGIENIHQETADLSAINTGQEILCNVNAHLGADSGGVFTTAAKCIPNG